MKVTTCYFYPYYGCDILKLILLCLFIFQRTIYLFSYSRMPNIHNNIRTTRRGLVTAEIMDLAAEEVLLRKVPFWDAANSYHLCHVTLYAQKKKKMFRQGSKSLPKVDYVSKKQVCNDEREKILAEYFIIIIYTLHCS